MAEAMKLQKMKLMAMNNLHGAGSQNGTESENDELNSNAGCTASWLFTQEMDMKGRPVTNDSSPLWKKKKKKKNHMI
ncbi:unnamed protein product [Coregonus sp. 'balchen']|nr:unnamed protein product [Coregonus sp. 'balchen']